MAKIKLPEAQRSLLEATLEEGRELQEQMEAALAAGLVSPAAVEENRLNLTRLESMLEIF